MPTFVPVRHLFPWLVLLSSAMAFGDDRLDRAERWLTRSFVHGDTAFLVGQGRLIRGQPPLTMMLDPALVANRKKFPYSLEYGLWTLRTQMVYAAASPKPPANDPTMDPAQVSLLLKAGPNAMSRYQQEGSLVVEVMKRALSCVRGKPAPDFAAPSYEYVSSHQVMAVLIAARRGCIATPDFQARLRPYVSRVNAELMATITDPVSDLYVERVAVLALAGYGDYVLPDVYNRIAMAQSADGAWRFDNALTPSSLPYEHGTALAYFALSSRMRGATAKR